MSRDEMEGYRIRAIRYTYQPLHEAAVVGTTFIGRNCIRPLCGLNMLFTCLVQRDFLSCVFHPWKAKQTCDHSCVFDFSDSEASVWRGVGSVKQLKPPYSLVTSSIRQAVQHGRHQVLDRRLHHLLLRHHHALQACRQIWSVDKLDFSRDLMSAWISWEKPL